jgi:hypothetical protein
MSNTSDFDLLSKRPDYSQFPRPPLRGLMSAVFTSNTERAGKLPSKKLQSGALSPSRLEDAGNRDFMQLS